MKTMMINTNYWYNYRTEQYELRNAPTTWQEACDYVPQLGGKGMLEIYCTHYNMPVLEAMIRVLKIAIGEEVEPLE